MKKMEGRKILEAMEERIVRTILQYFNRDKQEQTILLLVAVVLITVFSACSPLYPLNPWDDADVFMTVGKSLLSGKLMYRDVIDQKGPMLHLLHQFAAMVSYTSFFGIYLVECICMYFYLRYGLKIMRLFSNSNICLPLMCLTGFMTVTSDCFYYGDSVEEFCLPMLTQCLYYMLVYIKEERFPSHVQAIVVGLEAGVIFWMKFNIMLFYLGGFIVLAFIAYRRAEVKRLLRTVTWIVLGLIFVTAIIIAYFVFHHTLQDLYQAYFYNNLFLYNGASSTGEPNTWWFPLLKLTIWVILMLPVLLSKVRWEIKTLVSATYGMILLTYATLTVQLYYFVLLFAFSPLIIYYFRHVILSCKVICIMLAIVIWQTTFNWNIVTLMMGTFPTNILTMTDIVNKNHSDDSCILTYSSYDTGIYLKSRQLPPNSQFYIPNYKSDVIRQEQRRWVESGKVKYLVRWIGAVKTTHEYYDVPIPSNYHLIYEGQENYRYRFYTTPAKYLWNLVWTRPIMSSLNITPQVEPQLMLLYERRP